MRRLALGVMLATLALAACRKNEPAVAAGTAAVSPDTSAASTAPKPDPVITDSHTIYEAHSLAHTPFWTVEIFGQGIRYRWADNRAGVVFGAGRVEGGDSASVWTAKRTAATGPAALQIELLRGRCDDGSSTPSDYRVALVVDGRPVQGCANRGSHAAEVGVPQRDSASRRRP